MSINNVSYAQNSYQPSALPSLNNLKAQRSQSVGQGYQRNDNLNTGYNPNQSNVIPATGGIPDIHQLSPQGDGNENVKKEKGVGGFVGGIFKGVGKAGVDTVGGLFTLGKVVIGAVADPKSTVKSIGNGAVTFVKSPFQTTGKIAHGLVTGIVDPYAQSIKSGNYGEATGRAIFDVGLILLTAGADKKPNPVDDVTDNVDDIANNIDELDDVARGVDDVVDDVVDIVDDVADDVTRVTTPSGGNTSIGSGNATGTGNVIDNSINVTIINGEAKAGAAAATEATKFNARAVQSVLKETKGIGKVTAEKITTLMQQQGLTSIDDVSNLQNLLRAEAKLTSSQAQKIIGTLQGEGLLVKSSPAGGGIMGQIKDIQQARTAANAKVAETAIKSGAGGKVGGSGSVVTETVGRTGSTASNATRTAAGGTAAATETVSGTLGSIKDAIKGGWGQAKRGFTRIKDGLGIKLPGMPELPPWLDTGLTGIKNGLQGGKTIILNGTKFVKQHPILSSAVAGRVTSIIETGAANQDAIVK